MVAKPDSFMIQRDDNGAMHLPGMKMLGVTLNATDGTVVDLRGRGLSVVYAYPRTSPPGGTPRQPIAGDSGNSSIITGPRPALSDEGAK